MVRNYRENLLPGNSISELDSVLVVGPVESTHRLVKEMISDPHTHYNPLAIIDPTREEKYGMTRVSDVPVWSVRQALFRKERLKSIVAIILCWPGASKKQLDAAIEKLKALVDEQARTPRLVEITMLNEADEHVKSERLDPNLEFVHAFDIMDLLFSDQPTVECGKRNGLAHEISIRYGDTLHCVMNIGWHASASTRNVIIRYSDRVS